MSLTFIDLKRRGDFFVGSALKGEQKITLYALKELTGSLVVKNEQVVSTVIDGQECLHLKC